MSAHLRVAVVVDTVRVPIGVVGQDCTVAAVLGCSRWLELKSYGTTSTYIEILGMVFN